MLHLHSSRPYDKRGRQYVEHHMSMEVHVKGLKSGQNKHVLAEQIAAGLWDKLREKMKHWSHLEAH